MTTNQNNTQQDENKVFTRPDGAHYWRRGLVNVPHDAEFVLEAHVEEGSAVLYRTPTGENRYEVQFVSREARHNNARNDVTLGTTIGSAAAVP